MILFFIPAPSEVCSLSLPLYFIKNLIFVIFLLVSPSTIEISNVIFLQTWSSVVSFLESYTFCSITTFSFFGSGFEDSCKTAWILISSLILNSIDCFLLAACMITSDCLPSALIIILLFGCLIITGNNPWSSDSVSTVNLDCSNLPLYSDWIVSFLFFTICPIWFLNNIYIFLSQQLSRS